MPKRKTVPFIRETEKSSWNLYGLQALQPDRFIRVVQQILDGRFQVFRPNASERHGF
ncbi:MAG: hypothetical protein AB1752_06485 [Candidatus Zixiibacteriota bacterium]